MNEMPDEFSERIAQLERDLADADEEARELRNMICDEWRKYAATAPDLSEEERKIVELVRLMKSEGERKLRLEFRNDGMVALVVLDSTAGYISLSNAINDLERIRDTRLQPESPQRPTARQLTNAIYAALQDIAEGQVNEAEENLRVIVHQWDAAEKWEAEQAK